MTCHNRNARKSLEGMENGQPLWKTFLLVFCQSSTYVYNMTQQYTPQYSLKRHENRPTPRLVRDKSQQLLITRATNTGIDKRPWSVHTLEYSPATQRSKMTIRITTWRNLRNTKLRERHRTHLKRQNLKVKWGESAWVMGLVCLDCGGSYTPVCNY